MLSYFFQAMVIGAAFMTLSCSSGDRSSEDEPPPGDVTDSSPAEYDVDSHWEAIRELRRDGEYDRAKSESERVLRELRRQSISDYRFETTRALVETLAEVLEMDDDSRARLSWAEAMFDSTLEYYGLDQFEDACRTAREMVAIRQEILGEESLEVAEGRIYLSAVLEEGGHYAEAASAARAAHRRLLNERELNLYAIEAVVLAWAVAIEREGQVQEAEALYREHLRLSQMLYARDGQELALALNNLGDNLSNQGRYGEAEVYLQRALKIRRRFEAEDPTEFVRALANLGALYFQFGDYPKSESLCNEAIAERDRFDVVAPEVEKGVFRTLGAICHETGRYDEALRHLDQAFAELRELYGQSHPEIADLHILACNTYIRSGRLSEARREVNLALEMFAATKVSPSNPRWIGARITAADLSWAEEDYEGAERAYTDVASDYEESRRTNGIRSFQAVGYSPYAHRAACRLRLGEADKAWVDFERYRGRIVEDLLMERGASGENNLQSSGVQACLAPNEALVGWLEVSPMQPSAARWAFVLRSQGAVQWIPLAADTVYAPTTPERKFVKALSEQGAYQTLGHEVWKRRIQPLLPHLDGVEHVIVVPSSEMVGVPLEAVEPPRDVQSVDLRVSYIASGTVLTWLRNRSPSIVGKPVLAIADPAFGNVPQAEVTTGKTSFSAEDLGSLPRLPWSLKEIEPLRQYAPAGSEFLTDTEASESAIRRVRVSGLKRFGLVHFATHAFVNPIRPTHSFLALAQPKQDPAFAARDLDESDALDGRLTAAEINETWALSAGLVILSACETAAGPALAGEGFLGLSQTFLQVGARSVVVSLWPVEDEATAIFMRFFFEHLYSAGATPLAALEAARGDLRHYRSPLGAKRYDHPYFWAAFVVAGASE